MDSLHGCQHQHQYGINCQHLGPASVSQNLFEIDFDRGIWRAALDGEIQRLETLLSKNSNRIPVDLRDSTGFTALHYAVRKGDKFLDW
jgi:ankyrin repeat protein